MMDLNDNKYGDRIQYTVSREMEGSSQSNHPRMNVPERPSQSYRPSGGGGIGSEGGGVCLGR